MTKIYTDAQREAIETTGQHLCVDAGAGSGKTMVLIERILRLLDQGTSLDRIVAITFTERAAGEMKERLRREAHDRAPLDDPARMSFWRDVERRTDAARISTIHSFCMALLKEHALALNQDPDFSILNDAEGQLLRREIAESIVHDALDAGEEAAMRLAVELGGTKCIDELARLLKDRGKVQRALAVMPYDDPDALLRYWRIVSDRIVMNRLNDARPAIDDERNALLALEGCCTQPGDKRESMRVELLAAIDRLLHAPTCEHASAAATEIAAISATGGSVKNWPSHDAMARIKDARDTLKKLLLRIFPGEIDPSLELHAAQLTCDAAALYMRAADRYRAEKQERAVTEFDDLILDTLEILRTQPHICAAVAKSIRYLMIDEFQDTDNLQLELAERLADVDGGPELFFVGDAKQSIYYFRGAEVEVFRKARTIANKVIPLDRNFRTTPDVLACINEFFYQSGLLQRVEDPYHAMVPDRAFVGQPAIEVLLPPASEEKQLVKESRKHESELIARRILTLVNSPDPVCVYDDKLRESRPARFGDVALLFRTTSGLYLYEQALKEAGVPYYVVAGSGFYERQEIKDIRNLLHAVVDPHDSYALIGFLRSPIAGISDETLLHMQLHGGVACEFGRNDYAGPQAESIHAARALLEDLRARIDWPLPVFMRHVLDRTAYEAILLGQFLGEQKAGNLRKIMDLAHTFGKSRPASLRAFLRYLDEVSGSEMPEGEAAMLPEDGNAVILMTIHRSKGLEFPIVFVPNLGQGMREHAPGQSRITVHPEFGICLCPAGDDGDTVRVPFAAAIAREQRDKEKAEYARLLYVAVTRARDMLILSAGPKKPDPDSWLDHLASMLHLDGRASGAVNSGGEQWQWRVWSDLDVASVRAADAPQPMVDVGTIRRHIDTIRVVPVARRIFGVTEILDIMIPDPTRNTGHAHLARPNTALLRGSAVHRFLERWDFESNPVVLIDSVLCELGVSAGAQAVLRDDLSAIATGVRANAICRDCAATPRTMRERAFILRVGDALVRGELDALLPGGRILDYKTGTRPRIEDRYLWQLRSYAAAVEALDGAVADEALLFYVDTGDLVAVDVSRAFRADAMARAAEAITRLQHGIAIALSAGADDA